MSLQALKTILESFFAMAWISTICDEMSSALGEQEKESPIMGENDEGDVPSLAAMPDSATEQPAERKNKLAAAVFNSAKANWPDEMRDNPFCKCNRIWSS